METGYVFYYRAVDLLVFIPYVGLDDLFRACVGSGWSYVIIRFIKKV
jgi:hypothetical protein